MSTLSRFSQQTDKTFWKYGHLIFTSFYLLPLIINFDQFTTSQIGLCLAFYIAFIILYVKVINCDKKNITILFMALLAICFSATFFTSGTSTLFGFVAYVAGYSYNPKQRFYAALAIITALFASSHLSGMGKLEYFLAVSLILCAALFSYAIAAKREREHKKREHESATQLEQLAAIAERERIARDLHDILGHSLSSIALKAELASKLSQGQRYEQANSEIAQVAELARQLLSDVRSAVSDLKELNLVSQVAQLKQRLLEQDFNITFHVELSVLPAKVEGIASLIIKEAVTNLLRHSLTKKSVITIKQTPEQLLIEVIDNAPCKTLRAGNGLTGIKERAEQINGSAKFACGEQFTLNVVLPISSEDLQ